MSVITAPTISLTVGNTCPAGESYISSWELCRASLSLYSQGVNQGAIEGESYQGAETDEGWPKGCYHCDDVAGCADGAWFNTAETGAANGGARVLCSGELEPVGSGATLWVGDSDIDYWQNVEASYPTAYNVGYGGYTCPEVVSEAGSFIATFQPARVVLVCGENDLAGGADVQTTFSDYKRAVEAYRNAGATVYSFSTKPEPDSKDLYRQYEELDAEIKAWVVSLDALGSGEPAVVFIDTYGAFNDLGNPARIYADDGLHLSSYGYSLWEKYLNAAFADTAACVLWRGSVCDTGDTFPNLPSNSPSASPTASPTISSSESPVRSPPTITSTKSGKGKIAKSGKRSKKTKAGERIVRRA